MYGYSLERQKRNKTPCNTFGFSINKLRNRRVVYKKCWDILKFFFASDFPHDVKSGGTHTHIHVYGGYITLSTHTHTHLALHFLQSYQLPFPWFIAYAGALLLLLKLCPFILKPLRLIFISTINIINSPSNSNTGPISSSDINQMQFCLFMLEQAKKRAEEIKQRQWFQIINRPSGLQYEVQ